MAEHHIAHWILDLGLGGDAKNLVSLAGEQVKWARVTILTQEKELGQRAGSLDRNVEVVPGVVPSDALADWIVANRPQVLIVHRNGAPNSTETAIAEICSRNGVSCFEYNTFARVDKETDHLWSGHIHLSRASLTQYARRRGVSPFDLVSHKAIGYAVATTNGISEAERSEARRKLNVPVEAFVVSRLVRPDLRKWDPMPVLSMKKLVRQKIPAYLLLRAAPPERYSWIRDSLGNSVGLLEPSVVDVDVRNTLAASDVVVNYSVIGETFGLALAEAMEAGLPVIVNSTPQMDNAQTELCCHGERGLVANTVSSLSAALKYLRENPEAKERFGLAGRQFVDTTFAPAVVESRLRRFFGECLRAAGSQTGSGFPELSNDDQYQLTPKWLENYNSYQESFADGGNAFENLADDCQLKIARLEDSFLYARKIGMGGIIEKVARRLSQGSLLRG